MMLLIASDDNFGDEEVKVVVVVVVVAPTMALVTPVFRLSLYISTLEQLKFLLINFYWCSNRKGKNVCVCVCVCVCI